MKARYELREIGVYDRETGAEITALSGKPWAEYHDWLAIAGNAPDPKPAPPALPAAEILARKLAEIEVHAVAQRRLVTASASPQEMASWTVKRDQALAYDPSVGDASAPMLAQEAQARGVTTADIVARVRRNADDYSRAEAMIAGNAGKHRDAVRELVDDDKILAYDASGGWPIMPATPEKAPPLPPSPPAPWPPILVLQSPQKSG